MENIIFELKEEDKEDIYGGEARIVYVFDEEGECIRRYINE